MGSPPGSWGPLGLAHGRPALTSRRAVAVESRAGGGGGHNQKVKKRPGCQERPEGNRGGSHLPATPTFSASAPSLPCLVRTPLLSTRPAFCIRKGVALLAPRPHARKIHSSLTQGVPPHPLPLALTTLSNPQWRAFLPGLKFEVIGSAHISLYTGREPVRLGKGAVPKGVSGVAGCG